MIELVLKIIVFGAVVSGIWALVASGFSLIFGVARILNFAHGTLFVLSAYFGIVLVKNIGVNNYLAFILGILFVGIVGVIVFKLTISPIKTHEVMVVIVTLAIALLVEQFLLLIFGEHGISFPSLVGGIQNIGGIKITNIRILSLIIAIATLILLEFFITKTKTGKMITATSQDMEAAMLMGIDVDRIYLITMFISSILAGLGGLLYSQIFATTPIVSVKALIYAFAIVILGGLGSLRGSIIASFIVGYVIVVTITFLGARWSEFVMLLTIISILVVKPTGLFGVEE
ncbi:branched-chain amino acid ABC transporter permease [Archaeoglobales archaeon]|nr:MAG: branched-chain amino acid ABC transporter permease [Archaeoglobales archaeon]